MRPCWRGRRSSSGASRTLSSPLRLLWIGSRPPCDRTTSKRRSAWPTNSTPMRKHQRHPGLGHASLTARLAGGRTDIACDLFETAIDEYTRATRPLEAGRAQLDYGSFLRRLRACRCPRATERCVRDLRLARYDSLGRARASGASSDRRNSSPPRTGRAGPSHPAGASSRAVRRTGTFEPRGRRPAVSQPSHD